MFAHKTHPANREQRTLLEISSLTLRCLTTVGKTCAGTYRTEFIANLRLTHKHVHTGALDNCFCASVSLIEKVLQYL